MNRNKPGRIFYILGTISSIIAIIGLFLPRLRLEPTHYAGDPLNLGPEYNLFGMLLNGDNSVGEFNNYTQLAYTYLIVMLFILLLYGLGALGIGRQITDFLILPVAAFGWLLVYASFLLPDYESLYIGGRLYFGYDLVGWQVWGFGTLITWLLSIGTVISVGLSSPHKSVRSLN